MTYLSRDTVHEALRAVLNRRIPDDRKERLSIEPEQNLLEVVDSFGFAELILEMEAELQVELPLDQVDLASIVHVDSLVSFVCQNA
ncbi:MAG: hypothetical protein ACR2RA_08965 [Geminicoccaceae bacterium]